MMNETQIPLSNVPFFSICHFISAFTVFFLNNQLVKDDEQNQTIPVINVLTEYLNMSNESEGKTRLLKVLENSTKRKTNPNETYKDIVFQSLSDIRNLCSSSNGSSKMAPLELLGDYIWNYIQERDSGRFMNDNIQPLLKRIKRQPYADIYNISASEIIAAAESILNETSNDFYLSDSEYQRLVPFLQDDEPYVNPDLWNAEELDNILLSLQKNEHSLEDNSTKNQDMRSLEVLETTKLVEVGNKRQHDDTEKLIPRKIQSFDMLDGIPGTSKELEASILQRYPLSKDGGKSKRMLAIEKAANFMFSCQPKHAFTIYVNKLKSYLLKLQESITEIPTYDQLARDFCYNTSVLKNYQVWQIPKHDLIDDVLFGSNLDSIDTFQELKAKVKSTKYFKAVLDLKDFVTYKGSSLLRSSLRIQDYFLLKHALKSMTTTTTYMKNRLFVALYRLILRQCEEKWIENDITLYRIGHNRIMNISHNHAFKYCMEFSSDFHAEESKLITFNKSYSYFKMFKLELENQAGIAKIDHIFENVTRNYVIPSDMTFKVIGDEYVPILHHFEIYTVKLKDTRTKEEKLIEIVNKLYKIIINSPPTFFSYYN